MSAIQTGSDWWINSIARFPGGQIGGNVQPAAIDDTMNSKTLVISDYEKAGETGENVEADEYAPAGSISNRLSSGESDITQTDAMAASTAGQIEAIRAAMQLHQLTGDFDLSDGEDGSDNEVSNEAAQSAMTADLLQNPSLAFDATSVSDRTGIVSMLS
jgi:hypothetical protein